MFVSLETHDQNGTETPNNAQSASKVRSAQAQDKRFAVTSCLISGLSWRARAGSIYITASLAFAVFAASLEGIPGTPYLILLRERGRKPKISSGGRGRRAE